MERTPDQLLDGLLNVHKNWIEPVWRRTVQSSAKDASDFRDLCLDLLPICFPIIEEKITLTYLVTFLIYDELLEAFFRAAEGSYLSCARNLRYIFEHATIGALLEEKYALLPDDDMKFQQAFLDSDYRSFKRPMLQRLSPKLIDEREFEPLTKLYQELSKRAHPYGKLIRKLIESKPQTLALHDFDHDLFRECKEFARNVIDFVLVVFINKYPKLREKGELKDFAESFNLSMTKKRIP